MNSTQPKNINIFITNLRHCLFYALRCVVIFFVVYEFSLLFLLDPKISAVSAFFPAPAFIVALTYIHGPKYFPVIFLAAVTASFSDTPPWSLTLFNWLHITRQCLVYSIAGYALKRWLTTSTVNFSDTETVWRLIVTCLSAATLSAIIATSLFHTFDFIKTTHIPNTLFSFLVGDLTGLLMFTPLAFSLEGFFDSSKKTDLIRNNIKNIKFNHIRNLTLSTSISLLIFITIITNSSLSHFNYLIVIPIALVSVRYGVKTAIFTTFCVNVLSATLYSFTDSQIYTMLEIQMLYAVTALIGLLLGSYHDNQEAINKKLHSNQLMLANLARKSSLSELGSTIAHEIASPLQAALMNNQVAITLLQNNEKINRHLLIELNQDVDFALSKAVQIQRNISKGVTENKNIKIKSVMINHCIKDAQALLSELINKHNVDIYLDSINKNLLVNADQLSLTQVFVNLIKNAIQANANKIEITTSIINDIIIITLGNNGDEIDFNMHEKIFDSLFSTKDNGMGLGLSICKTMLEGFGGRIDLVNPNDSSITYKTTFRISLPKARRLEINE